MKTIGIIGAMEIEIISLKEKIDVISAKNIIGLDFFIGKMNGNNVVLVRSGVGKVNAAICTQILIDMFAVDYVINIGVAGAISKELEIGDIIISEDCVQHDFDTSALGDEPGFISGIDITYFHADPELIKISVEAADKLSAVRVVTGRIASGDHLVMDSEMKAKIWNRFKAVCVEMEGAAVAHAAYANRIPFVVIRSISDKADNSSAADYDKFVKSSAVMASNIVKEIIENL